MTKYSEQQLPKNTELDESLDALGYGFNIDDFKTW